MKSTVVFIVGLIIGLGIGSANTFRVSYQRDTALKAAESMSTSFNSMHEAFIKMETTANSCISRLRQVAQ